MPATLTRPQEATRQQPPPNKPAVGVAAHVLVIVFAITGVVIQRYVPYFAEPLRKLGEDPLPFYTVAVLRFQSVGLALASAIPVAALFVACRCRFKAPLPVATIVLIVLATVLEAGTAFALLKPMRGVIEAAESIKPVPESSIPPAGH